MYLLLKKMHPKTLTECSLVTFQAQAQEMLVMMYFASIALRHMPPQDQVKCGSCVEVAEIGPMNFVPTMNPVHLHVNFVSHK